MKPVLLKDAVATWANSAAANTEVTIALDGHNKGMASRRVRIYVRNPSAVTALTVRIQEQQEGSGAPTTFHDDGTTFQIAVSIGKFKDVEFWPNRASSRLSLKNDTILGAGDGFTADVEVWALDHDGPVA